MKKKIENLSMQTQLTVVILSVIVLAFGIILYSGYSGQARSFAEEYTSSTQTILEMDVANLDQYIQGCELPKINPLNAGFHPNNYAKFTCPACLQAYSVLFCSSSDVSPEVINARISS